MKPFSVGRRYEFRGMAADLPRAGQIRWRAKPRTGHGAESSGSKRDSGDYRGGYRRPLFAFGHREHIDHEGIWGRKATPRRFNFIDVDRG